MLNKGLPFNLKAIEAIKSSKPLNGKDGLMTPQIKQTAEAAIKAEQSKTWRTKVSGDLTTRY